MHVERVNCVGGGRGLLERLTDSFVINGLNLSSLSLNSALGQ